VETFKPGKENNKENEGIINKTSNLIRAKALSALMKNSTLDENRANNLYANRILEEERVAPDKSFRELIPPLPEDTQIVYLYGTPYAHIGDKMYYIKHRKNGFNLADNTSDFIPHVPQDKRKAELQKKYGLSDATEAVFDGTIYHFDESISDLDDWIIHNDMGQIRKNERAGEYQTWWKKGEPYKGMEKRSLIKDEPRGRHLFAKQSALEDSIGKPLDQHRELRGDVIRKGKIEAGGITITPTSEADLPKIEGLKTITYNPLTKSMERGIFDNPEKPNDEGTGDEKTEWYQEGEKS
jgi:hypothetical protein